MSANTTLLKLIKPTVSGDADVWGGYLNTDLDSVDKLLCAITTGGSGAAYTLTSGQSLAAYASGQGFWINASFTCNAAATLNVDGLGAKNITKNGTTATVSGDIVSGFIYRVVYDGTQFQVVGQLADATLNAIAALSWSSGSPLLQFTAADTVSLTLTPSVTSIALGAGAVGAPSLYMGGDTTTGLYRSGANAIAFTISGTLRMFLSSSGLDLSSTTTPIKLNAGSVGAPSVVVRGADTTTGIYSIGTGNWGFASGGVLAWDYNGTRALFAIDAVLPTAAPTSQLSAGFRGLGDQAAKTADYTFVAADQGKAIDHNSASTHTFTHNTGIVDKRQFISGMNLGAGALTIARGAGVTYRDAAGTNANLTVNQYQRYSILGTDTAETFSVRVF